MSEPLRTVPYEHSGDCTVKGGELNTQPEKIEFENLSQIADWVRQRSDIFSQRLEEFCDLAKRKYKGKVSDTLGLDNNGTFVGKDMCIAASDILGWGIERLIGGSFGKFQPWRVSLTLEPLHQVVQLVDMQSKESLLFDPTYKQIDPNFEGGILIFQTDEIDHYYPSSLTNQSVPKISEANSGFLSLKDYLNMDKEFMGGIERLRDAVAQAD